MTTTTDIYSGMRMTPEEFRSLPDTGRVLRTGERSAVRNA